ncbi:acyl-CoA dehydrogenase/oxidase [Protomyces lactucae-debilis]|uniref:Acyl-coenzyme A oxidase n=1 Tax=Protomyces lactucae-debilis TaxID=2754530 RepID=A0A1Y2FR50_PROLT|nr:acyl-CoA dehydrogenase/oxidase [Protomyces lactucae-debilis]ORY85676.1 acyl-CoA dehydrogenase/oxidase [Protomyces lactucae-debilis]
MANKQAMSTTQTVNDLEDARSKASFPLDEMSIVYARTQGVRDERRWLVSLLKDDPAFDRRKRHFMSRTERFRSAYDEAMAYMRITRVENEMEKQTRDMLRIYIDSYIPVWLNDSMCIPTVMAQSSTYQLETMGWEANFKAGRWLGCYCQTEMRHGSNLSGLQTTATFDQTTDEFVVHTPDPADAKYWCGGLGKTATHAIVQTKLIIHGKDHGLHPFLIQIRDLKTHKVLPNLEIHDIGPKLGSESMDNGYMRFYHFRTPRMTLLMKNVEVSREGVYTYLNPAAKVLARGTMSLVRVFLVDLAIHNMSRALTLAIRYSNLRRQGSTRNGASLEPRIAEYKSIQLRTLPYLSQVFPLLFASFYLRDLYNHQQEQLKADPFSKDTGDRLAELHAWSSGLKAYATQTSLEACNHCKESTGGIGYHKFAGFSFISSHPSAGVIIEGENWVLYGETCKYLVRSLKQSKSKATAYLQKTSTAASASWALKTAHGIRDERLQNALLEMRAKHLVEMALKRSQKPGPQQGSIDHEDAYNASRAHMQLFLLANFSERMSGPELKSLSAPTREVLFLLRDLFFATCVLTNLGELYPFMSSEQVEWVRELRDDLLPRVGQEAVRLVDAFDFDDWYLDSAIGNSKGNVYEQMYDMMRFDEPLNVEGVGMQDGVVKGWHETLQKVVEGKLGSFSDRKSKL